MPDIETGTETVKSPSGSATSDLILDNLNSGALAAVIRTEIGAARNGWRNALRHAMNAGDALIAAQPKVAEQGINWKKWLRENCFVSDRTAQLYQQLARNRKQIEEKGDDLSLRGARELISKRNADTEARTDPPETIAPAGVAGIDQHDGGGADHAHDGADQQTGRSATPKSVIPKLSPAEMAERKHRERFGNVLSAIQAHCTTAAEELVIPEFTVEERNKAATTVGECVFALQVLAARIGGVGAPKAETLSEHWSRSEGELTALLDVVGVQGVLEAMSDDFGGQLRARLPAPKRKSGKPFKHALNHTAHNGRGTHSRH